MSIIKVNKNSNYTVMSNYHLQEKEMSLKAKGLLSLMLSLPEDWDYSVGGLCSICVEKETAINAILKELKEFGYLTVDKLMPNQTSSGRIEYVYNIYECPNEKSKQEVEKQGIENLGVEILGIENQGQQNTNILNTNNKKNNKKENLEQCDDIFQEYNNQNIIHHKEMKEDIIKAITKALSKHSKEEIILSIQRYGEMYHSGYEYCNYKWNLKDFLTRDKGVSEFLDEGSKWNNYLNFKNQPKKSVSSAPTLPEFVY